MKTFDVSEYCSRFSLSGLASGIYGCHTGLEKVVRLVRRIMLSTEVDEVLVGHSGVQAAFLVKRIGQAVTPGEQVVIVSRDSAGVWLTDEFMHAMARNALMFINSDAGMIAKWVIDVNTVPLDSLSRYNWQNCVYEEEARIEKERKKEERKKKKESLVDDVGTDWWPELRFLVPDIGTIVRLEKDWTFRLHEEGRCNSLMKALGIQWPPVNWRHGNVREAKVHEVTLKVGAILKVSRVYIRRGTSGSGKSRSEFSSLTFGIQGKSILVYNGAEVKMRGGSFWAKLSDVNRMQVSVAVGSLAVN